MAISILYLNERNNSAEPIQSRILYHLSLDRSFSHICADVKKRNRFLSVISDLTDDKNEILYRQEVLKDFENNPDLAFAVPEEGTCVWMDAFAIPKNAVNKTYAEQFLDFLCRTDIAAMNFEYIYYSTPNAALIETLDAEILAEKAIFPADSVHDKATVLKYLGKETEELYSKLWKNVKS